MSELEWKWVYIPYLDAPEKQKESAIKAGYAKVYFKSEVDAEIESLKASHYAEMVDAGMRERRLKRALWLARAEMARTSAWVFWNREDDYNYNKWKNVERKCRAKAEEYK
jgi:hypothetical protein